MAVHIETIEIGNFRGLNNLNIEELGDVNIFVGDNNTGKTSVLEAIQFFCAPSKEQLVQISRQREKNRITMGLDFVESIRFLFNVTEENNYNQIAIDGVVHGRKVYFNACGEFEKRLLTLQEMVDKRRMRRGFVGESEEVETFVGQIRLEVGESSYLETFEIDKYSRIRSKPNKENVVLPGKIILPIDYIIENAFSNLTKNSKIKDEAVKLLKAEFEDNIFDLRIVNGPGNLSYIPVVEIQGGHYIPLSVYGDGMKKTLTILNAITSTQDGIVLIDEFETALHTSAMKQVFSFILNAAREMNIQLFLTTHSSEALDKMLEVAGENIKDVRVIRLKKKNGKIYSRILNGYEALESRKNYGMELRI